MKSVERLIRGRNRLADLEKVIKQSDKRDTEKENSFEREIISTYTGF